MDTQQLAVLSVDGNDDGSFCFEGQDCTASVSRLNLVDGLYIRLKLFNISNYCLGFGHSPLSLSFSLFLRTNRGDVIELTGEKQPILARIYPLVLLPFEMLAQCRKF